ncbi:MULTISPECIES: 2-hydroxychromene-2-carboxylate isomerase [Pseudomonadota]|uniref:2-hydroxychromene-2-carboxylate isomerase n=1 Tax=Pseudomonadota TaxID=1224 RepID=UPI00068FF355|nr:MULTISPECIES: 2-hydroxychromene-2-carboxylate isomerase [Pseudomonadota]MBI2748986.1 2-hydroxychromene-2-carboxylate isomerase [Burkholderiales bacterium]
MSQQTAAGEPAQIRFYFDFLSPYAYLARHRLAGLSASHGWHVDYRSIDLSRAKKAIGNVGPANRDMPVKLAHLAKDLSRWAELYGVELKFPPNFNSSRLNAGLYYSRCKGHESDYVRVAFRHVWGDGRAPDDPNILHAVAQEMGWDPDDFAAFTQSGAGLQAYSESTDEAILRHVFGVPTMVVGDEMWWGNDRLFFLEQFLNGDKK